MHNGAIVTKEMQDKAMFDDPDVVVIVAYLKDNNSVSAAITKTGPYVTGTINVDKNADGFTLKSGTQVSPADEEKVEVSANDLVVVVNGERMPEGFDLNTIDLATITSMEVLKTEKALKEYATDEGVIVITTDPSKTNEKKPVPDIYIDGKKATSEEVAALPANPKGTIAADGTVWISTYDKPEEKPQNSAPTFNGGTNAEFSKWVQANIRYPEGTTAKGRVSVSFTVSESGKVMDVKALQGPDQKLNDEAVRVISSSPDWTPALKDGKPTAIRLVIPVNFQK